jgi:hypothetical protein
MKIMAAGNILNRLLDQREQSHVLGQRRNRRLGILQVNIRPTRPWRGELREIDLA